MNLIENLYKTLIFENRYLYFLEGIKNTLVIAFFAVIIGIILGIIIALIRDYHENKKRIPILNFLAKSYVNIIRGTPVILQLMIIYYV